MAQHDLDPVDDHAVSIGGHATKPQSIVTPYTIALVGRANTGKSTLFNCLTRTRDALVADYPGLTHDRQYGHVHFGGQRLIVVDTAGLDTIKPNETLTAQQLTDQVQRQAQLAMDETDAIIFVVDAQDGSSPLDQHLAKKLRCYNKPIFLAINKTDKVDPIQAKADFSCLGFPLLYSISAAHRRGISPLLEGILEHLPQPTSAFSNIDTTQVTPLAVIGRPNSGKSTLINHFLNEEKLVVSNQSGTTRDCIATPFSYQEKDYLLLDTPGIRRRKYAKTHIEKLSFLKSLKAIEQAHIVIALLDAEVGLVEQDLRLLSLITNAGCGLIITINKCDRLSPSQCTAFKTMIKEQLRFLSFCPMCFISASHGIGTHALLDTVQKVHRAIHLTYSTSQLTQILEQAVEAYPPPLIGNRRIKLRYAHIGRYRPLTVIIHGKQVKQLPMTYQRYLSKQFTKALQLVGVPIRLAYRQNKNPYGVD